MYGELALQITAGLHECWQMEQRQACCVEHWNCVHFPWRFRALGVIELQPAVCVLSALKWCDVLTVHQEHVCPVRSCTAQRSAALMISLQVIRACRCTSRSRCCGVRAQAHTAYGSKWCPPSTSLHGSLINQDGHHFSRSCGDLAGVRQLRRTPGTSSLQSAPVILLYASDSLAALALQALHPSSSRKCICTTAAVWEAGQSQRQWR